MPERPSVHQYRLAAPESEFAQDFVQKMANRMSVSFHKYGPVADGYPHRVSALRSLAQHLDAYLLNGNTEHLIDAANYLMIEYLHPSLDGAEFVATDSDGSLGRTTVGQKVVGSPNIAIPVD